MKTGREKIEEKTSVLKNEWKVTCVNHTLFFVFFLNPNKRKKKG